jgi:hypothetical protein
VAACPVGTYSLAGAASCSSCPPGLFGATPALGSVACSGSCSAGYSCPAGSTNSTAVLCPRGTYSVGGAGACTSCPSGTYGNSTGLSTASCSGLCPAGLYGGAPGLTSASCTGNCSAGYLCPAGSTNGTSVPCQPGLYSQAAGAASCTLCPVGVFGSTSGLSSPSCSGPCAPGYFGSGLGMITSACSGVCSAGRFGSSGATNSSCSGMQSALDLRCRGLDRS